MRKDSRTIGELIRDTAVVEAALRRGAREAFRRHKLAGVPIVVWRDGKVVEIPPEKIRVPRERVRHSPRSNRQR